MTKRYNTIQTFIQLFTWKMELQSAFSIKTPQILTFLNFTRDRDRTVQRFFNYNFNLRLKST